MTKNDFDEHWPLYPSDGSGRQLLDLVAECNVDKLFKLQWDPKSEFLVWFTCASPRHINK